MPHTICKYSLIILVTELNPIKSFSGHILMPYYCLLAISMGVKILIFRPVFHIKVGPFDLYNQLFQEDQTQIAESYCQK